MSMKSPSDEPNDVSKDVNNSIPTGVTDTASSESSSNELLEMSEDQVGAELEASTPKTLPLKRGNAPLFVPAVLPAEDETPENEGESQQEVAPATSGSITEPEPELEITPQTVAPPVETSVVETSVVETPPKPELPSVEFYPPAEGAHNASVTLELRSTLSGSAVPSASIRYALDAEDVGENGLLYNPSEKIFLTQSTSVAARVFSNGQGGPLTVARFEIVQPGWKKIEPTDQSDATTHEIRDEAPLEGSWHLAAASVRGKLHAHRGGWREDAYRHGLAHAADGTYSVVVVSDGAGSAPLSRVGSNLLCQVALDYLLQVLGSSEPLSTDSKTLAERDLPTMRGFLVESARLALEKLTGEAEKRERPLSDFSATLLILVRREWNGQQLCAALQSGDGGIALWNDDDTLTILGEADHGQQSGETRFLTSNGMEAELPGRVKFSIRPNLHATAVMTDGIADDYFPEPERFPELFRTILPLVESPVEGNNALSPGAALLEWIDYEKKGSADDRALVVCWNARTLASGALLINAIAPVPIEDVQATREEIQAEVQSVSAEVQTVDERDLGANVTSQEPKDGA